MWPPSISVAIETETLLRDPNLELGWEQPVVAPDEDPGRDVRPGFERPRLLHRCHRLLRAAAGRLLHHLRWDVVHVHRHLVVCGVGGQADAGEVGPFGLVLPGVRPPFVPGLTGERNHRVEKDDEVDPNLFGDEWCGEPGEGLGDQYHVAPVLNRLDHAGCALTPAGALVAGRQSDR